MKLFLNSMGYMFLIFNKISIKSGSTIYFLPKQFLCKTTMTPGTTPAGHCEPTFAIKPLLRSLRQAHFMTEIFNLYVLSNNQA